MDDSLEFLDEMGVQPEPEPDTAVTELCNLPNCLKKATWKLLVFGDAFFYCNKHYRMMVNYKSIDKIFDKWVFKRL